MAALRTWLKSLPLSRRPLVKLSAKVAPEPAVKMLQAALPPRAREQAPVELENVAPTLLLPPTGEPIVGPRCTQALASGIEIARQARMQGISPHFSRQAPACPAALAPLSWLCREGRHGGGPGRRRV